jgi:hypothetical protein
MNEEIKLTVFYPEDGGSSEMLIPPAKEQAVTT